MDGDQMAGGLWIILKIVQVFIWLGYGGSLVLFLGLLLFLLWPARPPTSH